MSRKTVKTYCRFCHAYCPMVATVEDNRLTDLQPDTDNVVYGGYTCPKGRQMIEQIDHPTRLQQSVKRTADGGFAPVASAQALDEIAARRALFDALHIYSIQFETDGWWVGFGVRARRWMSRWVRAQDGLAVTTATVLPGYDDRRLDDRTGNRPTTPRREGRTFRLMLEAARAARPDWILIVSWNEWFEATEIEPSLENGARELEAVNNL